MVESWSVEKEKRCYNAVLLEKVKKSMRAFIKNEETAVYNEGSVW